MAWAIVVNNTIDNLVSYDGLSAFTPPFGTLEAVPDDVKVGWVRQENGVFAPSPPSPSTPPKVTRLDFLRLFTFAEHIRYETEKAKKGALTAEQWADPAPPMDVFLLRAFAIFQNMFDTLGEGLLDLGHPDTSQALDVFAALGIFGTDPAIIAARRAAVLAGTPPV